MKDKRLTIALAGNPNSGKTTVFNAITGARQHVGNYPGVTVEKKTGSTTHGDVRLDVVDLPGTYSLTAYSIEEVVTRNFLLDEKPDVVVDIVDSSNLERNLYLATQLMELGVPLVLAFNMSDMAKSRGYNIDENKLSELLGVPIVSTVGHKGKGISELLDAAMAVGQDPQATSRQRYPNYGYEIEPHLQQLANLLEEKCDIKQRSRWFAIKLLENDAETIKRLGQVCPEHIEELTLEAERIRKHIESVCGDAAEIIFADRRYGFISGACTEAVTQSVEKRHERSDKIDAVMTNRYLGLPIFALLMYLVFQLTFMLGNPAVDFLDGVINGDLKTAVTQLWPRGSDSLLKSLITDGIIGGVGAVIVFVPLIMLLFLAIAFLEDTGYMARAAFVTDRLMHKIGLHGKSFIPMLIGFGCTVPGIMATRTLETRRDRLTTILVLPLMSCGARMPIYMLILMAFFPEAWHAPMLWLIYMIGIALAIVAAKVLRSTLFKGESTPFVMELPPYRMPTIKGLLIHMWERAWLYVKKAGTIIFALAVILWVANTFPRKETFNKDYDAAAAQAEMTYVQDTSKLGPVMGLPEGSDILAGVVRAELKMAEEQEKYWQYEKGYAKAAEEKDAEIEKLTKTDATGLLATFLEIREKVVAAREEFDEAVEKEGLEEVFGLDEKGKDLDEAVEKGDLEKKDVQKYRGTKKVCDEAVAEAGKVNPDALAAVMTYLDEIKAVYDESVETLGNEQGAEEMEYSVSGRVGSAMLPVLKPMGFDNWRIGTALIGAFGAKEIFVGQMGIVYSLGEEVDEESEPLHEKLREDYSPLVGFCAMLFCLISAPCLATIAVTKRETNSWKWAMVQLVGLTILAYAITAIVYQVGSRLV